MIDTMTHYTTTECKHENFMYRVLRFKIFIFSVKLSTRVCTDCHKIIIDNKKWDLG